MVLLSELSCKVDTYLDAIKLFDSNVIFCVMTFPKFSLHIVFPQRNTWFHLTKNLIAQ